MPEISLPQFGLGMYALAALVIFIAAVVQSAFGMGFGQVAAPFLLLIDPTLVPVPILFMGMCVACLSAWRGRRDIIYPELGIALSGRLIGIFLAAEVMVVVVASPHFALVFASLILFAVAISLITKKFSPTPTALFIAGGLSGFMGTITSVGAPPMGLVYQSRAAAGVRATLNAFFGAGTILALSVLAMYGLVEAVHIVLAAALFPSLLLGTWAARFIFPYIDRQFRPLVLGICTLSALVILYKASL
ncbi:MAG: sulfite exporter TauE/SafE family protein [Rhodospirillales bacterium]|nr:sulfite exporter TauE/SafE family protein [Rhodospirillales bacterium]